MSENTPNPTSPVLSLSPYDTGVRCEAKPWLPYGTKVTEATPAENFGKVDFDDDEGHTVAVVHLERGADGRYTVHVNSLCADDEIQVELSLENDTFLVQPESLG